MKFSRSHLFALIAACAIAGGVFWMGSRVRRAAERAEDTLASLADRRSGVGSREKPVSHAQAVPRVEARDGASAAPRTDEVDEVLVQVAPETQGLSGSLARQYKDAYVFTGEVHRGMSTATGRHTTDAEMTKKEDLLLKNNPELRDQVEANRAERRHHAETNGRFQPSSSDE